ncbi:MAG: PAS domain-containing protein, partial [Spartobacteria bacterium]
MISARKNDRILRLVLLLAAVGLTTIVVLIGVVGYEMSSSHAERETLQSEQERLYQNSEDILRHSSAARGEIIAILAGEFVADASKETEKFAAVIQRMPDGAQQLSVEEARAGFKDLGEGLVGIKLRSLAWRARFDAVSQDIRERETLGQVLKQIGALRSAIETLEVLNKTEAKQSRRIALSRRHLAELATLVERLNGEEQLNHLPDLVDKELKPALERFGQELAALTEAQPDRGGLVVQALENLEATLFRERVQAAKAGDDASGLYALRRNVLLLRSEREELNNERFNLARRIDDAVAAYLRSARSESENLAAKMERELAFSRQRMTIAGACFALIFLWLAWLILRAIKGQIAVIEEVEQNLGKLQRDHESVLNAVGEGIQWIDCAGHILFENSAAKRLLGWDASELAGRSAHSVIHHSRPDGSPYPESECPIQVTLLTGLSQQVE